MTRYLTLERLLAAYVHQSRDQREQVASGAAEIVAALKRGGQFDPATAVVSIELADALREQLVRAGTSARQANRLLNLLSDAWWWGAREELAPPLQLFARVPRQGCQRMKVGRRDLAEPCCAAVTTPVVNRRPRRGPPKPAPPKPIEPLHQTPPRAEPAAPTGIRGWLGGLFKKPK